MADDTQNYDDQTQGEKGGQATDKDDDSRMKQDDSETSDLE